MEVYQWKAIRDIREEVVIMIALFEIKYIKQCRFKQCTMKQ